LRPIPSLPSGYLILRLHDKIKAEETTYTVKSMKIELVLKKATPGKWGSWRHKSSALFDDLAKAGLKHAGVEYHGEEAFVAHAKKLGIKDSADLSPSKFDGDLQAWYLDVCQKLSTKGLLDVTPLDSAADDVQFQPVLESKPAAENPAPKAAAPSYPTSAKGGPKNWDTLDLGDEDDEKDDGVDDFFKKLYKDADPDTRRAMMKSYVESNGTSLSTSWAEASKKTYETSPPDGSEAKKWD
jgi:suppressor of G2 allele of SKP1